MAYLPVAKRELNVQSRKKETFFLRLCISACGMMLLLTLVFTNSMAGPATAGKGRWIFEILGRMAFVFTLFGALATADSLSREKREGTLGLLFLTDLRGVDVLFGKLAAYGMQITYGLVALLPILSLVFLLGGVGTYEVICMVSALVSTMLLALSLGLFLSVISFNERKAMFAAVIGLIVINIVPYALMSLAQWREYRYWEPLAELIIYFSPWWLFTLASPKSVAGGIPSDFYVTLAVQQIFAWLLLLLAAKELPKQIHPRTQREAGNNWVKLYRRLAFGSPKNRQQTRRRLLDSNAFSWLAGHGPFRLSAPWILIIAMTCLAIWVEWTYSDVFEPIAVVLVLLTHLLLKVWLVSETCTRWVEDRISGALELILCTPMRPLQMLYGQVLANLRQFGLPALAAMILTFLAAFHISAKAVSYSWLIAAVFLLPLDLAALSFSGAHRSSTQAAGLNRSIIRSLLAVLGLRLLIFLPLVGVIHLLSLIGLLPPQWISKLNLIPSPGFFLILAAGIDLIIVLRAIRFFRQSFTPLAIQFNVVQEKPIETTNSVKAGADFSSIALPIRKPWFRKRHWQMAFSLLFVGLICIGAWLWHLRHLQGRIQEMYEEIKANGKPLTMEEAMEVRSRYHQVREPGDLNSILQQYQRKLGQIRAQGPMNVQFPTIPTEMKTEDRARLMQRLQQDLERTQQVMAPLSSLLHEIPKAGNLSLSLDSAPAMLTAHASSLGNLRKWMLHRIQFGDLETALESLGILARLQYAMEINSHDNMYQMNSFAFAVTTLEGLNYILNEFELEKRHLNILEGILKDLAPVPEAPHYIESLRLGISSQIDNLKNSFPFPGTGRKPAEFDEWKKFAMIKLDTWTGNLDRYHLDFLDFTMQLEALDDLPWAERYQKAKSILDTYESDYAESLTFKMHIANWAFIRDYYLKFTAVKVIQYRLARTAVAIERYRLDHDGMSPGSLKELVPEYINEIPRDIFVDEPLNYAPIENGYLLQSAGPAAIKVSP